MMVGDATKSTNCPSITDLFVMFPQQNVIELLKANTLIFQYAAARSLAVIIYESE